MSTRVIRVVSASLSLLDSHLLLLVSVHNSSPGATTKTIPLALDVCWSSPSCHGHGAHKTMTHEACCSWLQSSNMCIESRGQQRRWSHPNYSSQDPTRAHPRAYAWHWLCGHCQILITSSCPSLKPVILLTTSRLWFALCLLVLRQKPV